MILFDFLALVVIGLFAWGSVWVINSTRNRLDRRRVTVAELRKQLHDAEVTLRHIANGYSGNPELEASIALDQIERYNETKELS